MGYSVLLSDADGTLFDFNAGEENAITSTFALHGVPNTPENRACYHQANAEQWKLLEKGETTQQRLRTDRFRVFLSRIGHGADPGAMGETFVSELGKQRILLPGAEDFCRRISEKMPIYLITNGISAVQHSRFENCALSPYISGLIISEEVGHAKPHPAMIEKALADAGMSDPRQAVVFGDSITADIAAARNAGVDSILFTGGKPAPDGHGATHVARDYAEAERWILGG